MTPTRSPATRRSWPTGPTTLVAALACAVGCAAPEVPQRRLSLPEAIDTLAPAIVQVLADRPRSNGPEVLGTGFFVSDQGYLVTALHVITPAPGTRKRGLLAGLPFENTATIRGNFNMVRVSLVGQDEEHDLALLKTAENPFRAEPVGDLRLHVGVAKLTTARPRDGTSIAVAGYPLSEQVLITTAGTVASQWGMDLDMGPRKNSPQHLVLSDAYIADVVVNHGNSGGPVFEIASGEVIGMCEGFWNAPVHGGDVPLSYNSGLGLIVPAPYVLDLLAKTGVPTLAAP